MTGRIALIRRVAAAVVGGALILTLPPASSSSAAAGQAPVSAMLAVRLATGRITYAMGERIPLELEFRGRADADYYFSTETYDRSGRMVTEQFAVTPSEGVDDPLRDYFGSSGFAGGGLRGYQALDGTPFVLRVTLNDWVRFLRPGRYELSVTSSRLHRHTTGGHAPLRSAPITIEVVPASADWARGEVARAVRSIDGGEPDRMKDGAAILRHFGTEDAAMALLSRYDALAASEASFEHFFGLVASPHRQVLVDTMIQTIDTGEPPGRSFISALTIIERLQEASGAAPPTRADQEQRAARSEALTARWAAAAVRRAPTVAGLGALMTRLAEAEDIGFAATVSHQAAVSPVMAGAAFLALERRTQQVLLEFRWPVVNDPWLHAVLARAYDSLRPNESEGAEAAAIMLKRLAELDPVGVRNRLVEEIRTGRRGVPFDALTDLADRALPELDEALMARFMRPDSDRTGDRERAAWLLSRYGSAEVLGPLRAVLESPDTDCIVEAPLLVYLLKHDPAAAVRRLAPEFDRSVGCRTPPLADIARRHWDSRLENIVIARLNGIDVDRVAQSAMLLGEFGGDAAKPALLARLVAWRAEWQGRGSELDRFLPQMSDSPERIENAITSALFSNGRPWTLSVAEREQVFALCVTERCRKNLRRR